MIVNTLAGCPALGATVVSISNSLGFVIDEHGLAGEKMIALKSLAFDRSTELRAFADRFPSAIWSVGSGLWRSVSAEILNTPVASAVEAVHSLVLACGAGKNFARGLNAAAFLRLVDTL